MSRSLEKRIERVAEALQQAPVDCSWFRLLPEDQLRVLRGFLAAGDDASAAPIIAMAKRRRDLICRFDARQRKNRQYLEYLADHERINQLADVMERGKATQADEVEAADLIRQAQDRLAFYKRINPDVNWDSYV